MRYVKGDLLQAKERIIAHGCNAQGVMGAGVAKLIKEKYPDCFKLYQYRHSVHGLALGEVVLWESPNLTIANLITQDAYGRDSRQVNYEACARAFERLASEYDTWEGGKTEIAIPKIGAGLGGGSWNVIEAIIKEVEKNRPNVEFVVYSLDN